MSGGCLHRGGRAGVGVGLGVEGLTPDEGLTADVCMGCGLHGHVEYMEVVDIFSSSTILSFLTPLSPHSSRRADCLLACLPAGLTYVVCPH